MTLYKAFLRIIIGFRYPVMKLNVLQSNHTILLIDVNHTVTLAAIESMRYIAISNWNKIAFATLWAENTLSASKCIQKDM
jgi:hypothetical protein